MRRSKTLRSGLLLCIGALAAVVGCGDAADEAAEASGAAVVRVTLREYRIEMPEELKAGRTVFHVVNEGANHHSFMIDGEAVGPDAALREPLEPHAEARLEVDLVPGAYRASCPIAEGNVNHAAQGMTRTFRVTD